MQTDFAQISRVALMLGSLTMCFLQSGCASPAAPEPAAKDGFAPGTGEELGTLTTDDGVFIISLQNDNPLNRAVSIVEQDADGVFRSTTITGVSEDGARVPNPTAVEYAVMLSLIIVVCIVAITTLGVRADRYGNTYIAINDPGDPEKDEEPIDEEVQFTPEDFGAPSGTNPILDYYNDGGSSSDDRYPTATPSECELFDGQFITSTCDILPFLAPDQLAALVAHKLQQQGKDYGPNLQERLARIIEGSSESIVQFCARWRELKDTDAHPCDLIPQ